MAGHDHVKGAARALELFEALAAAEGPLSLTELARQIGIPLSSCHALVRTLQSRGYVYILDSRKRIYPTRKLAALGLSIARQDPVLERVMPVLRQISDSTGETVVLGKGQGDQVVYLDVVEGKHTVRFIAYAGDLRPTHSSAIGKAILGNLRGDQLSLAISGLNLKRVTEKTIASAEALRDDIAQGQRRGYYVSKGENVKDVMGIAVAQKVGEEFYAFGMAGPISRMEQNLEEYLVRLREAQASIEEMDHELRGN